MKLSLFLFISFLSYTCVCGNWFFDVARGLKEGIEDVYKKGEKDLESVKGKVEETKDKVPKFDIHKLKLNKLVKKAGHDVEKWHKEFVKKYGLGGDRKSKKEFHRRWKMINKWMKTLTKNDTDGDKQHHVPFIPHIYVKNDKSLKEGKRLKAEKIFKKFAKMWEEETNTKVRNEFNKKVNLFGKDEKKIEPKLAKENENLKKNVEEKFPIVKSEQDKPTFVEQHPQNKEPSYGELAFGIEEKEESEEEKKKLDSLEEKAGKLLPLFDEEEEKLQHLVKKEEVKPITEDELVKKAKAEAENWGERVDSLLSTKFAEVSGKPTLPYNEKEIVGKSMEDKSLPSSETKKEQSDNAKINQFWLKALGETAMKNVENVMNTKKVFQSFQKEANGEKKSFKEAEEKIAKEQKLFEEAEKQWEKEMIKKTELPKTPEIVNMKEPELTTDQKEIEEDLKEPTDSTFTPPDEEDERNVKLSVRPTAVFKFDKKEDEQQKLGSEEEEEHFPSVPLQVVEPASIFPIKESEQGFLKMREEIKPFFKEVDDEGFRKKALAEEEEWKKLKKFFKNKLFVANKKGKKQEMKSTNKKKSIIKEPAGYIVE